MRAAFQSFLQKCKDANTQLPSSASPPEAFLFHYGVSCLMSPKSYNRSVACLHPGVGALMVLKRYFEVRHEHKCTAFSSLLHASLA